MSQDTRVGYMFAHAIVDDHTRLAFVELHQDEKAATVTAFVARAVEWFATHDIHAKRLMSDNAFNCWPTDRSSTCAPSPTAYRPMERLSASTRPWPASGPTA
jgi:hypothetical protein